MKKISLFFLLFFAISHIAQAGDITKLLSDISKNKQVKITKATKEAGDEMLQKIGETINLWTSSVESLESMTWNDVPEKKFKAHRKRIESLKDSDGYQRMMSVGITGSEEMTTIIMMKVENKIITEVLAFLLTNRDSTISVLKMSGQMNVEKMKNWVQKGGKLGESKDATLDENENEDEKDIR